MAVPLRAKIGRVAAALFAIPALSVASTAEAEPIIVTPGTLPAIGHGDERFQSYNIEMAEVIGGRFWAPYPDPAVAKPTTGSPASMMAAMFRTLDPIDLKGNKRLRMLAKALGPAYVRVGGRWANTVYFQDDDKPKRAAPPPGFEGVLTRAQWAGVVDFARATDAKIVTSFPVSVGARDARGAWDPDQARRLINYTRSLGGKIYAAEVVNEPNVGALSGLPKGYDAAAFARDSAAFNHFLKSEAPEVKSIGPVATGEAGHQLFPNSPGSISTEAMMSASPRPVFDIFAYHFYGAASQRCSMLGKNVSISPDQALSEDWLGRADKAHDFYNRLHDRFAPGTPVWITEDGEASCGGDHWAATFLDSFRYIDQLGDMARRSVAAVFHNTLAASDYAFIDDATGQPRPTYWAALLWRRLMGEIVLDAGPAQGSVHLYAQCLRGTPSGVGLVAINVDRDKPATFGMPHSAQRYMLTADTLQSQTVKLNGRPLALTSDDHLPALKGLPTAKGRFTLPPASITFFAFSTAGNAACRSH